MEFHPLDRYLLGQATTKAEAIERTLLEAPPAPGAAPFYRGLAALGERAADEALVALRLTLAGLPPSDEAVRRLRGLSGLVRASTAGDAAEAARILRKDGAALSDLRPLEDDLPALGAAARQAYAELLSSEAR